MKRYLPSLPLALSLSLLMLTAQAETKQVAPFNSGKLWAMDAAIAQAIAQNKTPGGVLWLERESHLYHKPFGHRSIVPDIEVTTEDTLYDAASLTKVIATAPSIALLIERGLVLLDAPAQTYLPEFKAGKDITVKQLLTHHSGLRPGLSLRDPWEGYDAGIALACSQEPTTPPGTQFRYSDINYILLGEIVRRASGHPLDHFAKSEIYEPLGMLDTGFKPASCLLSRTAPTEVLPEQVLRGIVHDPTSRRMGGVAGHAGLFFTAPDLARFARMMLHQGMGENGRRIFKPETIQLMTQVHSPATSPNRRGLGWDIDTGYSRPRGALFPLGSYGHTGWTGTSIWIDPFSRTFLLFLSNRNHPTEDGSVLALRETLATLAAESVTDFDFLDIPSALLPNPESPLSLRAQSLARNPPAPPRVLDTLFGIDVLAAQHFAPLKNLRVGLITNHTGVDRDRRPTIDHFFESPEVNLLALFSPEHGIRGVKDEIVEDGVDTKTGLPIHSLYGKTRKPLPEHLENLDALVFDIQDIGCRFYTYISTMGLAMEAAAEHGLKFFVLDRPNPISGSIMEGPILQGTPDFVGFHPIPVRHGLTVGELARLFQAEKNLQVDLTIVPCAGWDRKAFYDQTGLPWTNPSPNMRNLKEALLYPGIGLLETTALSVGRGTDTPFEVLGAPYINDRQLADHLNRLGYPGIQFVPIQFTPNASVFANQTCQGVYILLTDRTTCPIVTVGVAIARTLQELYPESFNLPKFNRLLFHPPTVEGIRKQETMSVIQERWRSEWEQYQQRRETVLLY